MPALNIPAQFSAACFCGFNDFCLIKPNSDMVYGQVECVRDLVRCLALLVSGQQHAKRHLFRSSLHLPHIVSRPCNFAKTQTGQGNRKIGRSCAGEELESGRAARGRKIPKFGGPRGPDPWPPYREKNRAARGSCRTCIDAGGVPRCERSRGAQFAPGGSARGPQIQAVLTSH